MTGTPLRLLHVEDSDDDALLVFAALKRQGYVLESKRVMTAAGFRAALGDGGFDMILCDYAMPSFDAFEALEILRESGKDIPLIIVSGAIGEAEAVRAMRDGAADYLLKDNLIRLGAAVERELREAGIRRQKRLSDIFSRSQTEVLEMILDGVPLRRILERIANYVVHLSGTDMRCAIMLAFPKSEHLILGAEAGFEDGFFDSIGPFPLGEGMCSCGAAAASGQTVVFDDISSCSRWHLFREASRRAGLRACWSVPVFSSDREILATIGLYNQRPCSPEPDEMRWVESASKLASLAIERSRAAEHLKASEALLRIASEATHIGGWIAGHAEDRITWSDQVCAIHEVAPGTSPGFDEALGFCAPGWRDHVERVFARCLFEGVPFDEEMEIITARGRRIWVRAIGEPVRDEDGNVARIQGAYEDITDKKTAEEVLRANELRYLTQRNALIALTRDTQPDILQIEDTLLRITETTARTLGVGRVGVWRFTHDRQGIECIDLYEPAPDRHSSGLILNASDYPHYFECVETMELIAADDAVNDPHTREFRDDYLTPSGISSMLDVPIRLGKSVEHILCCEHTGPMRHWTPDEKTFAVAIANLISLTFEIRGRTHAQQELARSHRALRMLSSCNEMLIRATDEKALLAKACRIAVEIGGYRSAWVGYINETGPRRIVPMAHAGEELDLPSEIDGMCDGGNPMCGALSMGQTVIHDAASVRPEAARGPRHPNTVSLPLLSGGRVLGALCLHAAEAHPVGTEEIGMLREMADDLSFGIETIRSRKLRQRTEAVIIKVAQAVSSGAGFEFFDLIAANMVEAVGARAGLIGRFNAVTRSIDSISCVLDGKPMENFSYDLAGTPCEDVAGGEICVLERDARRLFPENQLLSRFGIEAYVGIPLLNQDGAVAGVMAVFFTSPLDETALVTSTLRIFAARAASELDRQQADARIREQASLLDKARDAILVRDLDHRITYWNKSAEDLYGWSAAEAIGRSVVDILYQEKSGYIEAHELTLLNGEWSGELTQVDKSGRELIIKGRWNLVRDDDGRPQCILAINTDISEYRRLELQFIRAQRLESIGILAGGIAHDLNNILTPISMAVELLRMRESGQRSLDLLDTIASSAKRGANMVGRVLSFARGTEGCHVRIHPRRLISEIESILRDTFPRNIELEFIAHRDLWIIDADPTQIHQVLLNLCVNAGDAISGAGRISISAENVHIDASFAAVNLEAAEGPYLCIRVQDSGAGIPADIIDRIFDPFFTTKAVGKGTGLGLPTTLAIVKKHGGFIRISSKPGGGTLVCVYLPAHPEIDESPRPLAPVDLPNGGGQLVLVVEDEAVIRQIACQTLENFGYRTLSASNGEEALALYAARHSEIAVVFTDLMMPVMDGPEMIRHMREINPQAEIIATSGNAPNPDSPHPAMDRVRHFLPKPYTAESLLKCIRQALENDDADLAEQTWKGE